jgi:hypothetical protein
LTLLDYSPGFETMLAWRVGDFLEGDEVLAIGSLCRTLFRGLMVLLVLGMSVFTASSANAVAVTHCVSGWSLSSPVQISLADCSGFVDNGAPYVFQIDKLTVSTIRTTPVVAPVRYYYDVTATCSGFRGGVDSPLVGTGCTI